MYLPILYTCNNIYNRGGAQVEVTRWGNARDTGWVLYLKLLHEAMYQVPGTATAVNEHLNRESK